jgi:hypothetical protein
MMKTEKIVEFGAGPATGYVSAETPGYPPVGRCDVSAETLGYPLVGHSDVPAET